MKYRDRADVTKIIARSVWRQGMETSPDFDEVVARRDDVTVECRSTVQPCETVTPRAVWAGATSGARRYAAGPNRS
jgi:hypothetical protein